MLDHNLRPAPTFFHHNRLMHELITSSRIPPGVPPVISEDEFFNGTIMRAAALVDCGTETGFCGGGEAYAHTELLLTSGSDNMLPFEIEGATEEHRTFSSSLQANEEESRKVKELSPDVADRFEAILECIDEVSCSGNGASSLICRLAPSLAQSTEDFVQSSSRRRGYAMLDQGESRYTKRLRACEDDCVDGDIDGVCSSSVSTVDSINGESERGCDSSDGVERDDECQELSETDSELQMLADSFGFEIPEQQCSSSDKEDVDCYDTSSSGSARRCRTEQINNTVKRFKGIIPGGDFHAPNVLDQFINYVKDLQSQVQTLGAKKVADQAKC